MAIKDHRARKLAPIPAASPPVEADIGARRTTETSGRQFPYPASRSGDRGPQTPRVHDGGTVPTPRSSKPL